MSGTTLILTEERKWDGSYVKIICKYEISSESVITPKVAILYIDGNLSEKDSKNETENIKRATYLKVEKAPTKQYDEYYKDGKQITSQDLMANKKPRQKNDAVLLFTLHGVGKIGYRVIVPSEHIILIPLPLSKGGLFDLIVIFSHSASVPP